MSSISVAMTVAFYPALTVVGPDIPPTALPEPRDGGTPSFHWARPFRTSAARTQADVTHSGSQTPLAAKLRLTIPVNGRQANAKVPIYTRRNPCEQLVIRYPNANIRFMATDVA